MTKPTILEIANLEIDEIEELQAIKRKYLKIQDLLAEYMEWTEYGNKKWVYIRTLEKVVDDLHEAMELTR